MLTSTYLDLGTWVPEAGGQGQVQGKEIEENGAGGGQERLIHFLFPRPCFCWPCSLSMLWYRLVDFPELNTHVSREPGAGKEA